MQTHHQKSKARKHSDNILPTDLEALKQTHQFVRDDEADEQHCDDWKVRMARRYYNKLYKEYVVIDLSRYTEGKYGLRWRTEQEVIQKKGQHICASKHCELKDKLSTYEVLFKYSEDGHTKRELVKVCLCEACSEKLRLSAAKRDELANKAATTQSIHTEPSTSRKKQRN